MLGEDDILEAIESGNFTLFFETYEDLFGLEKTIFAVNLFLIYLLQNFSELLSENARNCIRDMVRYLKGDATCECIESGANNIDRAIPWSKSYNLWNDEDYLNRVVHAMMQTAPFQGYEERERASFAALDLLEIKDDFDKNIPSLLQYIYNLKGEIRFEKVPGFELVII